MLKIYKSNRVENLMTALASVIGQTPENPMQAEWIGVQSKGMKQWITLCMAEKFGVSTNTKYVFPRQMVEYILSGFKPLATIDDPVSPNAGLNQDILFWSIFKALNKKTKDRAIDDLFAYIQSDSTGKKKFQLAMKIAIVFDDYQIYRPGMLLDWENEKQQPKFKDELIRWQADLWKMVPTRGIDHLPGKIEMFLRSFSPQQMIDRYLPHQMSLFGISALPPQFLQVFNVISNLIDIHLFFLVPSDQYFFDIKSQAQLDRIALNTESGFDAEQYHFETTNPLLSSWGAPIQSFCSTLETFDYLEPEPDLFVDPKESTKNMLTWIQSDILNLIDRTEKKNNLKISPQMGDPSIQIHACHSPMREAQVLKDLLLDAFENNSDLAPHDVIVMMPDIEAYAPFIESVFSLENSLPFAISDRRKRSESGVLKVFLQILALKNTRYERSQMLDLLLAEPIAQKFNLTHDDISKIEKMISDAGILWGKNGHHRESLGLPGFEENTWEFGLNRLFLGMAMPENHGDIVAGMLPCDSFEGIDNEVLGKLADFCNTLFFQLESLAYDQTINDWCLAFRRLTRLLFDRNLQTSEDLSFLNETFEQAEKEANRAGFSDTASFEVMAALLEQKLDLSIAQTNFMAGKMTFCNILPMRSIPFKIVVLMGMDESSFPRKNIRPGFDLIKKYPKPGDKNQRDDDRYLFLEALLSARSRFIVTYTGMNIQDNSLIPCSGVVSELADYIYQSFQISEESVSYFHPIHPFDKKYFQSPREPDVPQWFQSYSTDNLYIAKALSSGTVKKPVFIQEMPANIKEPDAEIILDEIIQFYRHPLKRWVQQGLNIQFPVISEPDLDREAFSLDGLDQYLLGSNLIQRLMESDEKKDFYPIFNAMGKLPYGAKGQIEYDRIVQDAIPVIERAASFFEHASIPAISCSTKIDVYSIAGQLSGIRENGRVILTYGKINGPRLISAWIEHLFLNLAGPTDYPKTTRIVGRDPSNQKPVTAYMFSPLGQEALPYLLDLTNFFTQGSRQPVFLFCETAWQFAQGFEKLGYSKSEENIAQVMTSSKVKTSWQGSNFSIGEKQDRYTTLCVENNDPFESSQTLLSSGFVDNAVRVYQPLLAHLQDLT